MTYGNDHAKKKFVVQGGKSEGKKCFKEDCRNEGEACKTCSMIQGRWVNYQQGGGK